MAQADGQRSIVNLDSMSERDTAHPKLSVHRQDDSLWVVAENENGEEFTDVSPFGNGGKKAFIVAGPPGIGKTTFLDQNHRRWKQYKAFLDKEVMIQWNLKQFNVSGLDEMLDNLPKCKRDNTQTWREAIEKIRSSDGRNLVVMIDHFERSSGFLTSLLRGSVLCECTIVVASQYSHCDTLNEVLKGRNKEFLHIKGVKQDSVHELLTRKGQQQRTKSVDRIADYIRANFDLETAFRNPMLVQELLKYFRSNNYQCPKTETALIKGILEGMLSKLDVESSELEDHLYAIGSFAFQSLKRGHFTPYEFSCMCVCLGIPGVTSKIGLGLMDIVVCDGRVSCKFLHKTIQAYLAARYLHKKPLFEQAQILLDIVLNVMSNNLYRMMITYFFGIAHTQATETSSINITKIALYPLLETMAQRLSLDKNKEPDSTTLLFFLACLYEAQDQSLMKKFLSRRQHLLKVPLNNDRMLAESGLQMLSYCLAHSGVDIWKVEILPEKRYLMDYLTMLVMDQLSSDIRFELKIIEGPLMLLTPVNPKSYVPNKSKSNIFSRIIREILHRLLQLYSPIKLKSDGSNVSYVSILACKCLQDVMESRNILTLEPIAAAHWLPVKPKSSIEQDTNPQTLHHMQQAEHGNQHVEYVLMTAPYPNRMKFIMPGIGDELIIEFCTTNSQNFNITRLEDRLDLNNAIPHIFCEETHFDANSAKLVLPRLPLPDQTHSKSIMLTPEASEPHRITQQRQRALENLEVLATPLPDTLQQLTVDSVDRRQGQVNIHSRSDNQTRAYRSPFSCLNGSTLDPIQASRLQRPLAVIAGIIIHTSIPDVFEADQVYPLPDEGHLLRLRKGGNGEVFVGVFSGMELVVKKTSYRSREIQIHRKLRHRNVVQLLCLMMGEQHPVGRKKWMCYHFLPKATGDLARLAIDNDSNTLKELRQQYGSDPRKFGQIQGNLRYILSEILQGLVYLHLLRVVHRDLKASNILLTFTCYCTNPLLCSCSNKCKVQLADFDSAVELTPDGSLPANRSSRTDRETFVTVPVGTNGYRAPELSLLTVSNDDALIYPRVCAKADVWSFGVLAMKMLIGEYGPSSQRELSMLLLYFHQEQSWGKSLALKSVQTGTKDRSCAISIGDDSILKLLKLPTLEKDVSWNERAVHLVKQCMQVDPDKRPSAKALCTHPLLF